MGVSLDFIFAGLNPDCICSIKFTRSIDTDLSITVFRYSVTGSSVVDYDVMSGRSIHQMAILANRETVPPWYIAAVTPAQSNTQIYVPHPILRIVTLHIEFNPSSSRVTYTLSDAVPFAIDVSLGYSSTSSGYVEHTEVIPAGKDYYRGAYISNVKSGIDVLRVTYPLEDIGILWSVDE